MADEKKIFRDGVAHITQEGYEQIRKDELNKWRGDPIDPLTTTIGGVKMPEPKPMIDRDALITRPPANAWSMNPPASAQPGLLDAAKAYVDRASRELHARVDIRAEKKKRGKR